MQFAFTNTTALRCVYSASIFRPLIGTRAQRAPDKQSPAGVTGLKRDVGERFEETRTQASAIATTMQTQTMRPAVVLELTANASPIGGLTKRKPSARRVLSYNVAFFLTMRI